MPPRRTGDRGSATSGMLWSVLVFVEISGADRLRADGFGQTASSFLVWETDGRTGYTADCGRGDDIMDVAVARALHVLAVVLWIGGVGLVTTVVLPALRRMPDPDRRLSMFKAIESRFSLQARISVIVVGLTGLYMLMRMNVWYRFALPAYWWLHAMVLIWAIFALMLFVVEPFVLHRRFTRYATVDSNAAFRILHRVHVVLLVASLLTIFGAVAGSYGFLLLD